METANTNGTDGAIYYLAPMTERAHFYEDGPPSGKPVTNMRFAPRGTRILNGRRMAQGASLDVEGFTQWQPAAPEHRSAHHRVSRELDSGAKSFPTPPSRPGRSRVSCRRTRSARG
jgi:hypothetical protein